MAGLCGENQPSQAILTVIKDVGKIDREDGPDFLLFINYSLWEAIYPWGATRVPLSKLV